MGNNESDLNMLFHAFADGTRRAILKELGRKPASVSALAEPFDMALPPFMKHIRALENAGLIKTHKQGRVRTCELNPDRYAEMEQWLHDQRVLWSSRYQKLDTLLEQMQGEAE